MILSSHCNTNNSLFAVIHSAVSVEGMVSWHCYVSCLLTVLPQFVHFVNKTTQLVLHGDLFQNIFKYLLIPTKHTVKYLQMPTQYPGMCRYLLVIVVFVATYVCNMHPILSTQKYLKISKNTWNARKYLQILTHLFTARPFSDQKGFVPSLVPITVDV